MDSSQQPILAQIAKELKVDQSVVEATVDLLDRGNTIPYISRYRKDVIGGLELRQLRQLNHRLVELRAIAERKSFILKSIESQDSKTEALRQKIEATHSIKEIEDLFLPYKSKKDSAATEARQRGLEPLAKDILEGVSPEIDLATRATDFVRVDKNLNSIDEVISGVADIIVEKFSDNGTVRTLLRKTLWEQGQWTTRQIASVPSASTPENDSAENTVVGDAAADGDSGASGVDNPPPVDHSPGAEVLIDGEQSTDSALPSEIETSEIETSEKEDTSTSSAADLETVANEPPLPAVEDSTANAEAASPGEASVEEPSKSDANPDSQASSSGIDLPHGDPTPVTETKDSDKSDNAGSAKEPTAKKKKKKKRSKEDNQFKEFFDFSCSLSKLTSIQILSIGRGERAKKIESEIQVADDQVKQTIGQHFYADDHPFASFLETCAENALQNNILPAMKREVVRDLIANAEEQAVQVFERNLRLQLLQPPVRANRLLAIHPGYRAGCNMAVLDAAGTRLANDRFHIVGNQSRQDEGRNKIVDLMKQHQVDLIAIGNGTGWRVVEKIIAGILNEHFQDTHLKFVVVNEAGVVSYATGETGREELPDLEPHVRSAVSIGRRLLDPLAELTKLAPGNLGVGVFQQDVKPKHLHALLCETVESAVNLVGVDVNSAPPTLIQHVAGLDAITARRMIEHRQANGRFESLEQLKQITGFGETTFVQAAGFMRVFHGSQPLDSTSIHPQNYELATRILEKIGCTVEDLPVRSPGPELPPAPATNDTSPEEGVAQGSSSVEQESDSASAIQSEGNVVASNHSELENSTEQTESATVVEPSVGDPNESVNSDSATPPQNSDVTESNAPPPSPVPALSEKISVPQKPAPSPEEFAAIVAKNREFRDKLKSLSAESLAKEFSVSHFLVRDLIQSMLRVGRDPRSDQAKPIFRKQISKIEDLKPGMQLKAQILTVVDFGAFVDIGIGESCLIHISQLSRKFVREPHRVFLVGEILNVWVTDIDLEKKRVGMTAIRPNDQRKPARPRHQKGSKQRSDQPRASHRRKESRPPRKPKKPKPVKPITQSMVDGDEAMRSFSDLAQFFKIKKETGDDQ